MGKNDITDTWIGYRHCTLNRSGMVCYELNQFEEAYKYFNDAYNYSKERAFQDRPKNI